jgi:lipoate---protein ligase
LTNLNTTWQLIPSIETDGKTQLAIDRWLLERYLLGEMPPTLRFYTWSQPTISLGYHQRQYPVHWQNLMWQDRQVDLVKRPTGGRGVLHCGDLTYAFIGSGFSGNRNAVYRQICQFLIDGWRSLGVDLQYGRGGTGYIHNPNCFGTATCADLVCADGYKLIGSAQLIKSGTIILQHGSMAIAPNLELFKAVFGESIALPDSKISQTALPEIERVLIDAARQHFNINFQVRSLADRDWAEIAALNLNSLVTT